MGKKKHRWLYWFLLPIIAVSICTVSIWSLLQTYAAAEPDFTNNETAWPGSSHNNFEINMDEGGLRAYESTASITALEYPDIADLTYSRSTNNGQSLLQIIAIPGDEEQITEKDYELTLTIQFKYQGSVTLEKQSYYKPVKVRVPEYEGCFCDIFIIAIPAERKEPNNKKLYENWDKEEWKAALAKYISQLRATAVLRGETKNIKGKIGEYQKSTYRMMGKLQRSVNILAGYSSVHYDSDPEEIINGGRLARISTFEPAQLEAVADIVMQYYLDYAEENRIKSPEIQKIAAGNTQAEQINQNSWLLTMPAGTDWEKVKESVEYQTAGPAKVEVSGSWNAGETLQITSYAKDPATAAVYNSDVNGVVKETCTLELQEGDTPYLEIASFEIGGRQASIDQEKQIISLHLADDTDWISKPAVSYTPGCTIMYGTGESKLDDLQPDSNGKIDFSKAKTVTVQADLSGFGKDAGSWSSDSKIYRKTYRLNLTKGNSDQCEITYFSFGIKGEKKEIVQNEKGDTRIKFTIPYDVSWESLKPVIRCSYDAILTGEENPDFEHSAQTPVTYTVTAQNKKDSKTYYVTVEKEIPSNECRILSFQVGSVIFSIDDEKGTITGKLPAGSLAGLRPEIRISPLATVTPESGHSVDLSSSVVYTVTAQDGTKKQYTVTVEKTQITENEYYGKMQAMVQSLIGQFKAKEPSNTVDRVANWERMCIGFSEKTLYTPPALPKNFNLQLETNDEGKVTDFERMVIALTANGIDAGRISEYGDGSVKKDLIGPIANCGVPTSLTGGDGIVNGVAFGLIVLDMGNYTLPADSKFDRGEAVEYLISIKLSDQSVDMNSMMAQALAPYRNDPIYGERVMTWYDSYVNWLVQKMNNYYFAFDSNGATLETQAQVVCGLCAAGIDPHTDPRFTDGTNSVLTRMFEYWVEDKQGFVHMKGGNIDWGFAQNQGCYALQWYLGFLDNGSQPYSLFYPGGPIHDFGRSLSTDAAITSFKLEGKTGEIDQSAGTITLTLPAGIPLNNMIPEVEVSEGAKLIAPHLPVTFVKNGDGTATRPIDFTVQAEDGKTEKTYQVTLLLDETVQASGTEIKKDTLKLQSSLQAEIELLDVAVTEVTVDGVSIIRMELFVGAGVNPSKIRLAGELSYGAVIRPAGAAASGAGANGKLDGETDYDLSGWSRFIVTAEDGTEQIYEIKVTPKQMAAIERFAVTVNGTVYEGVITLSSDSNDNRIEVTGLPSDADVSALAPEITLAEGTNVCSPLSGVAQNFADGKEISYTVSGPGLVSRVYKVRITDINGNAISSSGQQQPSQPTVPGCSITAFAINGVSGVINETEQTITVTLDSKTNITMLTPSITVSSGASVSPVSGQPQNFQQPVVYTVTNGTVTKAYLVTVILQKSLADQMWDKLPEEVHIVDSQTSYDDSFLSRDGTGNGGGSGGDGSGGFQFDQRSEDHSLLSR